VGGASVAFGNLDRPGNVVAAATARTDAAGSFTLRLPASGGYTAQVDGASIGLMLITEVDYRGDLLVHPGACVSQYGSIADGLTHRPVAGAAVRLLGKTVVTGSDGWYRMDFSCTGLIDFGTIF